jgi:hypothetical protein
MSGGLASEGDAVAGRRDAPLARRKAAKRERTDSAPSSAIASSSLVTEWVKGKTLEQAGSIKNSQIAEELALPPVKIHCSILAEDAIKAAIKDYELKCSCKV